jgi:hypothetical protein
MNTEQNSETTSPTMTPRDWFTLILRVLGVWELIATADEVVTILNINAGLWHPARTEIQSYIAHGIATFLIGIWLLKGAPTIARIFYPHKITAQNPN